MKAVGSTGILLATGVGSATARGPPSDGDTIVDVAASDDRFETLVAAVGAAGLVDTLSGNRQLTVFAPTDDAFAQALGVDASTVVDLPTDVLVDVLTYHVSPGRRNAESVTTSDGLPTLNGERIAVDGVVLNPGRADEAEIVVTDVPASNGIIHAIDYVLDPTL